MWSFMRGICSIISALKNGHSLSTAEHICFQQFSRFMREGYRFVETTEEHTLAAVSPTGDTLVVVSVNRAAHDRQMQVDMSGISRKGTRQKKARAYRTSGTENLAELPKGTIKTDKEKRLLFTVPSGSVLTLVIPLRKASL